MTLSHATVAYISVHDVIPGKQTTKQPVEC